MIFRTNGKLLSGYLTRMTGRTGSKVTLEQNYPFKEYGTDNATRVIISRY